MKTKSLLKPKYPNLISAVPDLLAVAELILLGDVNGLNATTRAVNTEYRNSPLCKSMDALVKAAADALEKAKATPAVPDRLALAHDVFHRVFKNTEHFRDTNIGNDLAYLLGAIIEPKREDEADTCVDWSEEECADTLELFHRIFEPDHVVWQFIIGHETKTH